MNIKLIYQQYYKMGLRAGVRARSRTPYKVFDLGAWNRRRLDLQSVYREVDSKGSARKELDNLLEELRAYRDSGEEPPTSFQKELADARDNWVDEAVEFRDDFIEFLEDTLQMFEDAQLIEAKEKLERKLGGKTPEAYFAPTFDDPFYGFQPMWSKKFYRNIFLKLGDLNTFIKKQMG